MIRETDFPGTRTERKRRMIADLALLTVSIVWGSAFVAQRMAAIEVGVFLFNGLRFMLGALVLLPFLWQSRAAGGKFSWKEGVNLKGAGMAGLLLFGGAALQQAGLQYTTAGNAGFITGLYVVLIPFILAVGWRQRLRTVTWVAALLAALGLFLLSTGGAMRLNPGDALELAGAFFWALHVILVGWLVKKMPIIHLAIGQYVVCGVFSLFVGLVLESNALPALANGWWAVLYTGVLSVGLGYTLQVFGQRVAPPADAAIILSLEAVFAALFGWLFLNEALSTVQLLGCGIMLSGILLAQSHLFWQK